MFLIRARVWIPGFPGELDWTAWCTISAEAVEDAVRMARKRWPEAEEMQVRQWQGS